MSFYRIPKECNLINILLNATPKEELIRHPIFGNWREALGIDQYLLNDICINNNENTVRYYLTLERDVIYRIHLCSKSFKKELGDKFLYLRTENDARELCQIDTNQKNELFFILGMKGKPISLRNFSKISVLKTLLPKKYIFEELAGKIEKTDLWSCTLSKREIRVRFDTLISPNRQYIMRTGFSCHIDECKATHKDEFWTPFWND